MNCLSLAAAAAALALLPAAALAAPAEEVFAEAVLSCLARHTRGAVPDVLAAERVAPADPADPRIAKVNEEHGATLKVASDAGGVYIPEEAIRCEVRGFDLDPMAAALAADRRLKAKPYKAVSPLGKIIEAEGMILGGLVVKTPKGEMLVTIGRMKADEPRTLFATVKNF